MSGPGESTWNDAMDRVRAALIDSERLCDLMRAGEVDSQRDRYGHRGI
jgi:hypothetical protein